MRKNKVGGAWSTHAYNIFIDEIERKGPLEG
jgi:hypothetical protein